MKKTFYTTLAFLLAIIGVCLFISKSNMTKLPQSPKLSKYKGEEVRAISSLSASDIHSLETGTGDAYGGLAKLTELNGYPGPRHVLDMRDDLKLSAEQIKKTQEIYEVMKGSAIPTGKLIISLEQQINDGLREKNIDETKLEDLLQQSATLYGKLRFIHNKTHLAMTQILSKDQVESYNQLRGYSFADPCQNVPSGHDQEMWKLHNNC